jgi:hypothetical protein
MFELRRNSDQNPLSKVGAKYSEDISRDFSIMAPSERLVAVEGIEITVLGHVRHPRKLKTPAVCCRPSCS